MEDNDIIDLYWRRDQSAISETAEKYGRLCCKIANNILGDEHEADECVNDAYFGLWRTIPPERPDCLRAFIAKVVRNLSITRLRKNLAAKRRTEAAISLSELDDIIPDTSSLDEIEDRELGRWISDFLYTENESARNVFIRKYWFFDSVVDIADKYGYTEAKIKSMLFHTRNRLRKYLTEKGVTV